MHLPGQGVLVSHPPQQGTLKNAWLPAEVGIWGIYTSGGILPSLRILKFP